ncbi:MAG: oxidoreductase [Bacteroidetes bacterium GWE2_41_25]|nr:MAG: oxidoreductase [Bacteroidetes bacterium GWA2_40_15]OFX86139.1 MAG: oxidoreductase [Bacteroidetes bacterium GWC2_40_22]OFY12766.1 MAG: oxidoreductase [Bacteroidetes bacterium GWE2_41_25]OFY61733.1 MAG: oxidoreductase [Bacteroidetes bacterium GWF2_41_9]HAM11117.1 oxidoreductase [Bacteroidales bacterium]
MMKKIKMGMIGGGIGAFIGDAHRRASRICNDFEMVGGVFDADYEKSKQFAKKEGIPAERCYKTVDALIKAETAMPADKRMEVVAIVTPNALHFPFAIALLTAGFHLVCEKPMTMTVEEAVELEKLVAKKKLTFALTHTYTGYPMVRQMRDIIAKGTLGTIQRIDAQYYQGWINSIIHGTESRITGVWRLDPKHAGASSCMGDIGVHAFNLIEYTTGLEIKEVLSDLNPVKEGVKLDLDGTVLVRFSKNLKGVIRASQVCGGEENNLTIAVYGSKASLKWGQENPNYLTMLSDTEPAKIFKPAHGYNDKLAEASHTMPNGHPEGIYEALANIYKGTAKSIRGEKFTPGEFPTVHDGVRGMKFIHAVVESNKAGNKWVKV